MEGCLFCAGGGTEGFGYGVGEGVSFILSFWAGIDWGVGDGGRQGGGGGGGGGGGVKERKGVLHKRPWAKTTERDSRGGEDGLQEKRGSFVR